MFDFDGDGDVLVREGGSERVAGGRRGTHGVPGGALRECRQWWLWLWSAWHGTAAFGLQVQGPGGPVADQWFWSGERLISVTRWVTVQAG